MKCIICNIVIGDFDGYCIDTEIHGGYACEECCNNTEIGE